MKVLICDDEADARLLLNQYCSYHKQLEIIGEATNGFEAVEAINNLEPDLIFLDIQMPGLSGFQVLQKIVHIPQIIFSTAFDKYALKAFDNNAIDYLLKPYTKVRFDQALNKILANSKANIDGLKNLGNNLQANYNVYPEMVLVEYGNRLISLKTNDIFYIEAEGDYTKLHTETKNYLSNFGIGVLEQKLNPSLFLRIHRSTIINIAKVKEVYKESNGYYVILNNEISLKVGRSYTNGIKGLAL